MILHESHLTTVSFRACTPMLQTPTCAHTEPMPDDASWLDGVVVPDDLSDLQADVEAYHRELRHTARRRRIARLTGSRTWQRVALPATVAVGSLTIAAAVFAILTLGHPTRVAGPPPGPIATAPTGAVGQVGGLVPDVTVRTSDGAMPLRDLRPALVALVPMPCDCRSLLDALAGQAAEVGVPLIVVAPANQDAEVDALAGQLHHGTVQPVFDLHGEMAQTFAREGVTVLGMRTDATVSFIQRNVTSDMHFEMSLEQMVGPTASLSAR